MKFLAEVVVLAIVAYSSPAVGCIFMGNTSTIIGMSGPHGQQDSMNGRPILLMAAAPWLKSRDIYKLILVNIIVVDDLATCVARSSTTMVLTYLFCKISLSDE